MAAFNCHSLATGTGQANLGQTVEKPQELSGKICLREVLREIRLSEGKSDYPRDLPWANFQIHPKAFPQLVRLQASKTEENVSRRSSLNIFWVYRRVV